MLELVVAALVLLVGSIPNALFHSGAAIAHCLRWWRLFYRDTRTRSLGYEDARTFLWGAWAVGCMWMAWVIYSLHCDISFTGRIVWTAAWVTLFYGYMGTRGTLEVLRTRREVSAQWLSAQRLIEGDEDSPDE